MYRGFAVLTGLVLALVLTVQAEARPWRPTPGNLALDYTQIADDRGKGEVVIVWWFVPQILANAPSLRALVDEYTVIAVVHSHIGSDGNMAFEPDAVVTVKDGNGQTLAPISGTAVPPKLTELLSNLQGMARQALGPMGQGVHWLVFQGGSAHACQKGGLSVGYAGETYTYDTPIPGCQPL